MTPGSLVRPRRRDAGQPQARCSRHTKNSATLQCGPDSLLRRHHVPSSRVFTMADIFRDPHFTARNAIIAASGAELDTVALSAPVPKLSETPGRIDHAGGEIGADTVDVVACYANTTEAEIEDLLDEGVVFDAEHSRRRVASSSAQLAPVDPT
ncbi:MAG TPA: CoA transferase [Casimicrobiaceae bacterium]|nr:CoA transferase [Casimicrobiaceae bacterium]